MRMKTFIIVAIFLSYSDTTLDLQQKCQPGAAFKVYADNPINTCVCQIDSANQCAYPNADRFLTTYGAVDDKPLTVSLIFIECGCYLNLLVIDADGKTLHYGNGISSTGGVYQIDYANNLIPGYVFHHVFFSNPINGTYKVQTSSAECDPTNKISFTAVVNNTGAVTHVSNFQTGDNGVFKTFYEFEYSQVIENV